MSRYLLAFLLLSLPALAQVQRKLPRITIENDVWDFGLQPQHTVVTHKFRLKNEGTSELRIVNVTKSCTCAGAVVGKKNLAPGESTEVEARFETRTFKGAVSKVLQVISNDPVSPRLRLTVRGRVTPPFWLSPQDLNLGQLRKVVGTEKGREFRLIMARNTKLQIKKISSSHPLLSIVPVPGPNGELERERADGSREIVYRASLAPGYPVGLLQEIITIRTDIAASPVSSLKVGGNVLGEVSLTPRTFNLGRVKQGEGASRDVVLSKAGQPDLKIEALSVSAPDIFDVSYKEIEKGRRFKITVALKDGVARKYHRGKLTIRTNCTGEKIQKAWFYVIVH